MKQSKKYRKMNRGLLLGCILLAAVILYTVITALTFQTQKDEIRETVSGFVKEVAALQVQQGSDAEKNATFTNILSKYVTEKGISRGDSYDNGKMRDAYAEFLATVDERVQVTEMNVRFNESEPKKNFYITRAGVSYASVGLNVRIDYKIEMPQYVFEQHSDIASMLYMPGSIVEKIVYEKFEDADETIRRYAGTLQYEVGIIMEKSGGEWQISSVDSVYLYGSMNEDRT